MDSTQGQQYRIASELRRCCWYTVVGAVLVGGVAYWLALGMQNRGPADARLACVPFVLLACATAYPLRWRLRLDGEGIWRRRLLWWDLWRWSDLASGRVHKRHPHTLYDPERSWRQRKLRLGYMAASDIREVVSAINRHYRLPPPPETPEELTVKYGIRRSVTFDDNGVHVVGGGASNSYLWNEVRQVRVTRMDSLRRDFTRLVVVLPDQEIELRLFTYQGRTMPAFKGATPEEVNEVLVHRVSPERIDTYIAGERLTKREDIERELAAATKRIREFTVMTAMMLAILIGALVYMAIQMSVLAAVVIGGLIGIMYGPLFVFVYIAERKRIDELNRWLGDAIEAEQTAVACGSGLNNVG